MKRKHAFFVAGILALVVVLLIWWPRRAEQTPVARHPPKAATNNLSEPVQDKSTNAATPPPEVTKAMRATILSENIPIQFWGKVVDQDNQPLESVKVKLYTMRGNEYAPGKFNYPVEHRDLTTAADGQFALTDANGYTLTVEALEKEGYRSEKLPKRFAYTGRPEPELFIPEPQKPVVFKMWEKGEPEPLVQAEKFYGIIPDGRVYTIDLLNIKKIDGASQQGDLQIKVQRPAGVARNDKYDWSLDIDAIGGGVIETNDEFMDQAPETGYQPRFQLVMNPTNPKWSHRVNKKFYLKSRNGQLYARMEVEVFSNYQNEGALGVRYFANPSGSRNLEYDPAKEIKAGK